MPARKNMTIYQEAVKIAISENKWENHPNKKEKRKKYY